MARIARSIQRGGGDDLLQHHVPDRRTDCRRSWHLRRGGGRLADRLGAVPDRHRAARRPPGDDAPARAGYLNPMIEARSPARDGRAPITIRWDAWQWSGREEEAGGRRHHHTERDPAEGFNEWR